MKSRKIKHSKKKVKLTIHGGKTLRSKLYQSIYGKGGGGIQGFRSPKQLFM